MKKRSTASAASPVTRCEAKTGAGGSELFLYGDIGAGWFGEGITAETVKEELATCKGALSVYINSAGGSVFEGLAIYSQLRRYDGGAVTCFVDGLAASIASIIALAGSRTEMSRASLMMIHEAQAIVLGNAGDMRKCADDLDTVTGTMRGVYTAKTGMSDKEAGALMAAETWLSAADCVAKGFADAIVADEAPDEGDGGEVAARLVDTYRNTPANLRHMPQAIALARATLTLQRDTLRRSPAGGDPRPAGRSRNGKG